MKSILDPSFRYTSSVNTDLSKTFARIRKAQRIAQEAQREANAYDSDGNAKVRDIMAQRVKGKA